MCENDVGVEHPRKGDTHTHTHTKWGVENPLPPPPPFFFFFLSQLWSSALVLIFPFQNFKKWSNFELKIISGQHFVFVPFFSFEIKKKKKNLNHRRWNKTLQVHLGKCAAESSAEAVRTKWQQMERRNCARQEVREVPGVSSLYSGKFFNNKNKKSGRPFFIFGVVDEVSVTCCTLTLHTYMFIRRSNSQHHSRWPALPLFFFSFKEGGSLISVNVGAEQFPMSGFWFARFSNWTQLLWRPDKNTHTTPFWCRTVDKLPPPKKMDRF